MAEHNNSQINGPLNNNNLSFKTIFTIHFWQLIKNIILNVSNLLTKMN